MIKKIGKLQQFVLDSGLALGVLASRFVALAPNFSPLGSFGFFNGNLVAFFGSIIVFDLVKGGFYPGFWLTYLGFAGYWLLGKVAGSHFKKRLVLLPAASFTFFLLSNLGVWWYYFPHTGEGLLRCYLLALPFYRNTFISDLVFGYGWLFINRYVWSSIKTGDFRLFKHQIYQGVK